MVGNIEFVEQDDITLAQKGRHAGQGEKRGGIKVRIHVNHSGEGRVVGIALILAQKFIKGILKQTFDKRPPGIIHKGDIKAESTLFKKMPIFRQSFEGVKAIES